MSWFRWRRPPQESKEVVEAVEKRDAVLGELDHAIEEVDRVHARVLNAYRLAEQERVTKDR